MLRMKKIDGFLLLFTISGKCCGRLKYFRPMAGTYFQKKKIEKIGKHMKS